MSIVMVDLRIENRIFWWLAVRHVSHTAFYPNFGDLLARHEDHGCRCKLCASHRRRDAKWRAANMPAPPQANLSKHRDKRNENGHAGIG